MKIFTVTVVRTAQQTALIEAEAEDAELARHFAELVALDDDLVRWIHLKTVDPPTAIRADAA
jgi:hypothetical protein